MHFSKVFALESQVSTLSRFALDNNCYFEIRVPIQSFTPTA